MSEDYPEYEDYPPYSSEDSYDEEESAPANQVFPTKMILLAAIIIIALMIALLIQFSVPPEDTESSISLNDKKGGVITMRGSRSEDGDVTETFSVDGNVLSVNMKPSEGEATARFNIDGLSEGTHVASISMGGGTLFTVLSDEVTVNDDGTISINIEAIDNSLLEDGVTYDINSLITIETDTDGDGNVDEVVIIEVPIEIFVQEYVSLGCLSLDTTEVFESTHYGMLEKEFKFRSNCNLGSPLYASVEWNDDRVGTVEVYIDGASPEGQNLTENKVSMKNALSTTREYEGKIIFMPFSEYAGEEAIFDVQLTYGDTVAEINFELALDNLEQCISFSDEDLVIEDSSDRASITVDASTCHSDRVEIYVCPNDSGCSGGAEEGRINPSTGYFYLSPGSNSSRTITATRGDIPGVYGMNFYAAVPGHDMTFISEKEILVMPSDTILKPDKFSISLLGPGAIDSIRVRHDELSEDVAIETSICNFEDEINDDSGWWVEFANDSERYAGSGKYQASLYNALSWIDYTYLSARSLSQQENYKIKTTFNDTVDAYDVTVDAHTETVTSLEKVQVADDAAGETVDLEETQQVLSLASTTVSAYSLYTSMTTACSSARTLATNATTLNSSAQALVCSQNQYIKTQSETAMTSAEAASDSLCGLSAGNIYSAWQTLTQLNSLYESYSEGTDEAAISVDDALSLTQEAMTDIDDALEHSTNAIDYMKLALEAASPDSTDTVSPGHSSAADYIALAKAENLAAKELINSAKDKIIEADSYLTEAAEQNGCSIEDLGECEVTEINELIASIASLIELIASAIMTIETASSKLITAQTAINAITTCSCCTAVGADTCSQDVGTCATVMGNKVTASSSAATAVSTCNTSLANAGQVLGLLNTSLSLYDTYQSVANNAGTEIIAATIQNASTLNGLIEAELGEDMAYSSKDAAITAANNLATNEFESSDGSLYTKTGYVSGDFKEERLSGFISNAVSSGFISGAYQGGVYTTEETFGAGTTLIGFSESSSNSDKIYFATDTPTSSSILSDFTEDCDNRIELMLPDYKINLLQDAKSIQIPGGDILTGWLTGNAKVFDVFEGQEVGIKFVNNSLYENTYETVTLTFDKHSHTNPTIESGSFAPFDITDSSLETIEEKFHFKFNAEPRKATFPVTKTINTCSRGLLRGNTGEDALPENQLTWDWEEVDEEKYLDAAQLSIVLSKKLARLNDVMKSSPASCPTDPAIRILQSVKPLDVTISNSQCYLPFSSWYYDGKPAMYYYLENSFVPVEGVSSLEDLMELIDFNAHLVMDGYGIEFQSDFEREYTSQAFESNTDFTNSSQGISKYFANDKYSYFSSEAKGFASDNDFMIPDAGKYRVRILGDFEDGSMFNGSTPSAELVFDLYSLQPVSENFSPFYYMPLDGSVGARAVNDRRYYGIEGTQELPIDKSSNIYISPDQEDALYTIKTTNPENFFEMNSLNSKRGEILDLVFTYNPKENSVDGSEISFSPNYATPIIFAVPGNNYGPSTFKYYPKEGSRPVSSKYKNMTFLTGTEDCSYFGSGKLSDSVYMASDNISSDEKYFVALNSGSGTAFMKTVIFSPTDDSYALEYDSSSESGYFVTPLGESEGTVVLGGISGMQYNDAGGGSNLIGLREVFEGVKEGNICVSRFGDREIYWWPGDYIYSVENSDGTSISDIESTLKSQCG